jgi:hypothetical protein
MRHTSHVVRGQVCLAVSHDQFSKEERFAASSVKPVGSTALPKIPRVVTFLSVHGESVKLAGLHEERICLYRDNDIVPVNTDLRGTHMQGCTYCMRDTEEDQRLQLKGKTVPHTGELLVVELRLTQDAKL